MAKEREERSSCRCFFVGLLLLEDGPEIGSEEDSCSTNERRFEGFLVIQVAFDKLDTFSSLVLGGLRLWVASDATNFPISKAQKCCRN